MIINQSAFRFLLTTLVSATLLWPLSDAKAEPAEVKLTAPGVKLQNFYAAQAKTLRAQIEKALPQLDAKQKEVFLLAHYHEGPKKGVQGKQGERPKALRWPGQGNYSSFSHEKDSLQQARPLLKQADAALSSGKLDKALTTITVIHRATPKGLAAFAQQSPKHKKLIDTLLANPVLMKEMIVAGGAKAGRYGKAMEILSNIHDATDHPVKGVLHRLALASALELAAPELCQYEHIDPVKRYLAYEKWYLAKQLDPHFENFSVWQYRRVINDRATEEDMEWLRAMLHNYRPDIIDTKIDRDRYTAIFEEMPHKGPEWDEDITRIQATLNAGGRCGPKAFFGRAVTRSFGIPTWGMRVKRHTAMSHWTPKGWTTALGIGWSSSYWTNDGAESMYSTLFRLDAMAREHPSQYEKAARAGMIGDALGEDRIEGMMAGTCGLWHALALNQKRAIVTDAHPEFKGPEQVWAVDSYPNRRDGRQGTMLTATIKPEHREIKTSGDTITIPAAACTSPTKDTAKILFMESRLGGMQLHYQRKGAPETFSYEVSVPKAGSYELCAKVVTINRGQSLQFKVNGMGEQIDLPLPFTLGEWKETEPVSVSLKAGKNTLSFTRQVPEGYAKTYWQHSGPQHGGVSIHAFTLKAK